MFDASQWIVFFMASVALVAVPGPAVMFIVTRSVAGGRGAGLATATGVGLGNLIHATCAAFGVSAVIASTDGALATVRYSGAAYLIYLGVRALFAKPSSVATMEAELSRRSDFWKGVWVALLNPKVILFLLAFLPQFVNAERGDVSTQLLVLGVCFVIIGWLGDSSWALFSGSLSSRLRRQGSSQYGALLSAGVYIVLGIATAISG